MTKDLLAVLDMSEKEQKKAIQKIVCPKDSCNYYCCLESLAFRLRDEVCHWERDAYLSAMCKVAEHWEGVCICDKCFAKKRGERPMDWWADSKPIHWIIAALIAKDK